MDTHPGKNTRIVKAGPSQIKAVKQKSVSLAISEGKTRAEIEDRFGVKLAFIKEACEKHGVVFEPLGLNSDRTFKILSDLANTRLTLTDISTRYGVSVATVSGLHRKALENELFTSQRVKGQDLPRKALKIAIHFDDNLVDASDKYRGIIGTIGHVAEILIIASRPDYDESEVCTRLNGLGFGFDRIILTSSISECVRIQKCDLFISSDDSEICEIDQGTTVLKVREMGNFDFEDLLWVYDSRTGTQA